jgi:hypothetical protein
LDRSLRQILTPKRERRLQLLEHQLSLQELLLDFVQKGKELDFSPPAPPPPPGQDFYADLNLDAAKRTDDELKVRSCLAAIRGWGHS